MEEATASPLAIPETHWPARGRAERRCRRRWRPAVLAGHALLLTTADRQAQQETSGYHNAPIHTWAPIHFGSVAPIPPRAAQRGPAGVSIQYPVSSVDRCNSPTPWRCSGALKGPILGIKARLKPHTPQQCMLQASHSMVKVTRARGPVNGNSSIYKQILSVCLLHKGLSPVNQTSIRVS